MCWVLWCDGGELGEQEARFFACSRAIYLWGGERIGMAIFDLGLDLG